MSIETWKEEFLDEIIDDKNSREAVLQSLKKYKGATLENLKKHNLAKNKFHIADYNGGSYEFSGDNCSLCDIYFHGGEYNCENCPLSLGNNGIDCFHKKSAYHRFTFNNEDAELMIIALENALKYVDEDDD